MAALYNEAGAVVAAGFTVLRESSLTQRRTDVVHDSITGGLPYVVRKDPAGLVGSLEFLCPSAEMADAIYAAHQAGLLRLDDWRRQNIVTDPRATQAPPWQAGAGTGGVITETMVAGASDGPLLPDGTRATTYARYVVTTANTAGTLYFGTNTNALDLPVSYPSGTPLAAGIYLRCSTARTWGLSAPVKLNGGAESNQQITNLLSIPAATWQRVGYRFPSSPAAFDAAAIRALLMGGNGTVGMTVDVTCATAVPGAASLLDHFDGATLDSATLVNDWSGVANNSVSSQYERPALDLTYLPVGGCGFPVRASRNYWRVSVPGIQEVAA